MLTTKAHSFSTKFLSSLVLSLLFGVSALAANSVPRNIDYQGIILDAHNNPVTTALTFRFSLWSNGDFVSTDKNTDGSLAVSQSFSGYQEIQNITPDKNGNFRTAIGIVNPLPTLDANIHRYLQVEVKSTDANDTNYEILDIDNNLENSTDRKLLSSAPYAITTEAIELSDLGYGAGKIPTLNTEGKIEESAIPNKMQGTTFTLNSNDETGDIKLEFGGSLKKAIKWTAETLRFEIGDSLFIWGNLATQGNNYFGDDLNDVTEVSGNLTVKGTLNGRDIAADGAKIDSIQDMDTDDQTAEEVAFSNENFKATNVYDALLGLKNLISSLATQASELIFTPTSTITASNTQDAIVEVDSKVGLVRSEIDSIKNSNQLTLSSLKEEFLASDNEVKTAFQNADSSLKRELLANDSSIQNALQTSQNSLKDELLKNDIDIEDSLQSQIEALKTEISSTQSSIVEKTNFNWDFLSATDASGKKSGDGNQNKAFVALRDGVVTGISVSSNPTDSSSSGTFIITKNDNGSYTSSKRMTSISLNKSGIGDSNNTAFTANPQGETAGLSFKAGDVIRAYHEGKDDDENSNLVLEIQYNGTLSATSNVQSSNRWQELIQQRLEEIKKNRGNGKKALQYYN